MIRKVCVCTSAFFLVTSLFLIMQYELFAKGKDRRDEKIFLLGVNSIAAGKYDQSRILLNTLIYTYPDSPLVGQAKILIFYSDASDENHKSEPARSILHDIESYLAARYPKPRDP